MKTILLTGLSLLCTLGASANQISAEQQKYVDQYKKQKHIVAPEDALLNTEPEPNLTEGFTNLYNGKNLDGWTPRGGFCTFEADGDSILGTCVKGSPSTYLCTDKDYSNFIFTAELKWEVDGNSGILYRSRYKTNPDKEHEIVYGPQCEMEGFARDRQWSGGIYGQGTVAWQYPLWLEAHEEARAALKKDDWNRITIQANGPVIKTWINGVPAAHFIDDKFLDGFFGLQVHSGHQGTIRFRNLKVKELEPH
ncbi:MAG: DUF1080 domain-containing protein [Verrucomicrobiota bacterium]